MHHSAVGFLLAGLFLMLLSGCATFNPLSSLPPNDSLEPIKIGDIIDTATGRTIPFERLMGELAAARVIYVGETHTSVQDHRIQLKIAEALHARNPKLSIAMEMFPRESQAALDRYTGGITSEEEFLKESQWAKVWGFSFDLYRPILSFARNQHLTVIGLNIPPSLSHRISRNGLDSLTSSERSQLAEQFDFNNLEHRNYVREEYEQHTRGSIKGFETFYEAQLAWEETMAETLARALATADQREQVIVIIGTGHINYRFGVPERAERRVQHTYKTVLPLPLDYPGAMLDPKLADFVWVTREEEPAPRGKLGVMIKELAEGAGVEVLAVMPGGPAEKAGIQKGDVLYLVDGIPLKTVEQLQQIVAQETRVHEITLRRGTRHISVTVFVPR